MRNGFQLRVGGQCNVGVVAKVMGFEKEDWERFKVGEVSCAKGGELISSSLLFCSANEVCCRSLTCSRRARARRRL